MLRYVAALPLCAFLAIPLPALAAGADGDWACTTLIGVTPVVYLALSDSAYVLTRPDGTQAKGALAYTASPIVGFMIEGVWRDEFAVNEATLLGSDRLIVSGMDGGISLMCEPGKPEKS